MEEVDVRNGDNRNRGWIAMVGELCKNNLILHLIPYCQLPHLPEPCITISLPSRNLFHK